MTTGNGKKTAGAWSTGLMALPLWVMLAATAAPTMVGCGAAEAQRAKEAAAKRDDAERAAFVAELEAALTAKDIEKAAAAFTPARQALFKAKPRVWRDGQQRLWSAVRDQLDAADKRGALATCVVLCETMEKALLEPELGRDVAEAKTKYKTRLDNQLASWEKQLEPARADEAAGRPATAAMRYAALTSAPSKSMLATAQQQVCGLIAKAAAPHKLSVHMQAGKGDPALMQAVLAAVAKAPHGSAVTLLDKPEGADVVVTLTLGAERVEKTKRAEPRSGRYVSGQKQQPNPALESLQKDVAYNDKEARWHLGKVQSIRCSGGQSNCKLKDSHRNSARSFQEKADRARDKLRREPATKMGPVYTDVTYEVTIHKTMVVLPVSFVAVWKDGKRENRTSDMSRWHEAIEQPAVAKLNLAAKPAEVADVAKLSSQIKETILQQAGLAVHHNLDRRAIEMLKGIQTSTGTDRAERICAYFAVMPMANQDSVTYANGELAKLLSVYNGATALATATKRCAAEAIGATSK